MIKLLNGQFVYFVAPLFVSVLLLIIFFNIPYTLMEGIVALFAPVFFLFLLGKLFFPSGIDVVSAVRDIRVRSWDKLLILLLAFIVLLAGPVDIFINGFKLLNPSTYADIHGIGRYVRHFSSMCWILIPVAFLLIKRRWLKRILITYAFIFPILIIDRNRFFLSAFVFVFVYIIFYKKSNLFFKLFFLFSFLLIAFSIVGYYRSGSSFEVLSSGSILLENHLPLKDVFLELPVFIQQIVLYITTPIFNFSTIYSESFINEAFLEKQLSPFSREYFESSVYAPILVSRYNVGTEFFPFLLYGGMQYVYVALLLMYLSFVMSMYYLRASKNIFALLIFLKITHTILFMGFAPQFFILLNAVFIMLMILLIILSTLLGTQKVHRGIK